MRIRTHNTFPPIPIRDFDWCAYDDDTYDGADDAGPQCVGYGRTVEEAIADFLRECGWGDQGLPQ